MRTTNMFYSASLIAAVGVLLLAGCGSSQSVGTLQGKVTFAEQPVSDARVQIQSSATGHAAAADVDAAGNYRFATPLTTGEYAVCIVPKFDAPPAGSTLDLTPAPARPDIPEKYRTPATSGFTVTLSEGDNRFDVKLTK